MEYYPFFFSRYGNSTISSTTRSSQVNFPPFFERNSITPSTSSSRSRGSRCDADRRVSIRSKKGRYLHRSRSDMIFYQEFPQDEQAWMNSRISSNRRRRWYLLFQQGQILPSDDWSSHSKCHLSLEGRYLGISLVLCR